MSPTTDFASVKLGKAPPKVDVRTLRLAAYVDTTKLPAPPAELDLTAKVADWPMYGNDTRGDCTCAAAGHMIEAWTASAAGKAVEVPAADIIKAFDAVEVVQGGEEGAVEIDVLKYWRKTGIGDHKIGAFARVSTYDHQMLETAAWLFGGLYIGLQLPESAKRQATWDWNGTLTGPDAPGSWGGHAVDVVRYGKAGVTLVTWGTLMQATWAFWDHYCDEAYAILTQDWFDGRKSPDGFDLEALQKDLGLVTG